MAINTSALMQQFDRGLQSILDKNFKLMNHACLKVGMKVERTEKKLLYFTKTLRKKTSVDLLMAESLVHKELRSKIIMSEWTSSFLAASNDATLDPVTFAFARFALNICLCYKDVPASYFIGSKIHVLLVSLLSFDSELVVGPAILGLVHLSLHPEMRVEIVSAGALPMILKLMVKSNSVPILTQCSKLIASLTLFFPNKPQVASSGCLHTSIDLLSGIKTGDKKVRNAACCAVTNTVLGSDSNRVLCIELDAIRPLLSTIQFGDDDICIYHAIKAIANIAYNNSFTASKVLAFGGDVVLIDVISTSDVLTTTTSNIIYVSLIALTNICNSETNQAHVGSSKGGISTFIRVLEHGRYVCVA